MTLNHKGTHGALCVQNTLEGIGKFGNSLLYIPSLQVLLEEGIPGILLKEGGYRLSALPGENRLVKQ